jgi:hypothetical protein
MAVGYRAGRELSKARAAQHVIRADCPLRPRDQ